MLRFLFRKYLQKHIDAAVAVITESMQGRHAEYIKTLELDNEKLRNMVAVLTVDNVDSYNTYMVQARKEIRKLKIGQRMDCHIKLFNGAWEIYHVLATPCEGYDCLKEYQISVRPAAGNPEKDNYVFAGRSEYWKCVATKDILHSYSGKELFRHFKSDFEELSQDGFFPTSGHR